MSQHAMYATQSALYFWNEGTKKISINAKDITAQPVLDELDKPAPLK